MKIAIVGKGTASIITSLTCISRGHEVDVFYDPETSHINVGESTTPHFSSLIYKVLKISAHDLVEKNITSLKAGIKFINWGKGNNFLHNFAGNSVAFHFENKQLNPFLNGYLEENNLVTFIPEKVNGYNIELNLVNINGRLYDFVIFCSGWENKDNYLKPIFSTVNSAYLYQVNSLDEDPLHTLHKATEDGWEFGLPFLKKKITKHGYLFNRNIKSSNDVKKDLTEKNIKPYEYLEWNPRYAKKLIQNNHCAFNGNRLFFIEPLQALTLYYAIEYSNLICDYLDNRTEFNYYKINDAYQYEMWAYQLSLAFHYQYGSTFNSEFWSKTQENAKSFMSKIPNGNIELFEQSMETDLRFNGETSYSKIGCFGVYDLKQIYSGMIS